MLDCLLQSFLNKVDPCISLITHPNIPPLPSKKLPPFLPHIAYDSVVFGFADGQLKVLVMKYQQTNLYALPGGFVKADEDLDEAVQAGLKERTGLDQIYLEQFHVFGSVDRHQPEVMRKILLANGLSLEKNAWMMERFLSVGYYALISIEDVVLKPDALSDFIGWYDLRKLPRLMLDHQRIVDKALQTLRENLERKLSGVNLLPRYFTMNELQMVYESILDEKMHRGAFQRKMLGLGILQRHEKQYSGGAHRAPYLYSFIQKKKRPS
jgi:8-oxo-dGTP diphosphatase